MISYVIACAMSGRPRGWSIPQHSASVLFEHETCIELFCWRFRFDGARQSFDEGRSSFEEVELASIRLTTAPSRDEDVALFGGGYMEWWVRSTHTPGHVTWEAGRCRVR